MKAIKKEFSASKRIPKRGYFANKFSCTDCSRARQYREMMRKSDILLMKEMDLQKFLHR